MTFELRTFQEDAVRELLEYFQKARDGYNAAEIHSAIGLTATTGAGKTVIASAVLEAILFGSDRFGVQADPKATFLWMTDLPSLNIQTQEKMLTASSRLRWEVLPIIDNTFNRETLAPGHIYFLNTQLLAKSSLLAREGPTLARVFTFWDVIRNTVAEHENRGTTLYLVVDEAHRGMTEGRELAEANSIIQRFILGYPDEGMPAVPVVWGISATPQRFLDLVANTDRARFRCDVSPDEVRASGLIKERTKAEFAGERQTDAMALFPEAVRRWWQSTADWETYHRQYPVGEVLVVPALVVQVENVGSDSVSATDLARTITAITDISGPLPDDTFRHSFGEHVDLTIGGRLVRYIEPSKIAGDVEARVIFYKDALGTGWDCPRAEVMFSFRRAFDPTSIAQTIGRMVRAPLARRIEESVELNAAHVFLPHYNRAAVEAVVKHLASSGNQAIAETIEIGSTSIALPLREMPTAIAAIEGLPTYVVPSRPQRSTLRFLAKMARFLSASGIEEVAKQREANDGAAQLIHQQGALAGDARFLREVDEQGEIVTELAEALMGESELSSSGTRRLQATEETIDREFAQARAKLTPEIADAYVLKRIGDGATIRQAKLEARALSARPSILARLEAWASSRIDYLRQAHGARIESLPPNSRSKYFDDILQQAPDPTPRAMHLLPTAEFRKGDDALPRHLYGEADTDPALAMGSSWERETIQNELGEPDSVAWLRNVDRAVWALRLPRREGNGWRPFFPDFLAVHQQGDRVVVDLLDPHDHTKPDAVSKAKGLSAYARKHAERVRHVDLIAKIGDRYRRLHLEHEAVRKRVDAISTNAELDFLLRGDN